MANPRKPLAGILPGSTGGDDDIFDLFETTKAADELGPLPKGSYVALAISGRLDNSRTGKRCYTIEFRVTEGEYAGRRLWMSKYLTPAAMPMTVRDLEKFGIKDRTKLREPFPADQIVCELKVNVRNQDDGTQNNNIKDFKVIRVLRPVADPYAPGPDAGPSTGNETDFPFGANDGRIQ